MVYTSCLGVPMPIPLPPVDASGGYMIVSYNVSNDRHKLRFHVLPFSTALFGVTVAGVETIQPGDDGRHNYAYQPATPAGAEIGVLDTFHAYITLIAAFFRPGTTFSLSALYQVNPGPPVTITPIGATPVATPISGSAAAGPDQAGQLRALEIIYNMKTSGGGKARIALMEPPVNGALNPPVTLTSAGGGNASAQEGPLLTYLSGANTAVVGHDGHKLLNFATQTSVINRKLRRKYGYA